VPKLWQQIQRSCGPLALGGVTLGLIDSFGLINCAYFFTSLISSILSLFIRLGTGSLDFFSFLVGGGTSQIG